MDKILELTKTHVSTTPLLAAIRVTGADAADFLQGQFTQDLRGLTRSRQVAYGLWLNQKGKILADSYVWSPDGHTFLIWSAHSPGKLILQRLEAYLIADEVELTLLAPLFRSLLFAGAGTDAWVASLIGELPPDHHFAPHAEGWFYRARRGLNEAWQWLGPASAFTSPPFPPLAPESLELAAIQACLPRIPAEFGPADLPQEAGLETCAISFQKGCYLGQEVMARLHAMGQTRRRLLRVRSSSPLPLPLPAPLFHQGKRIGELRAATSLPDAGFLGLALLNLLSLPPDHLLSLTPEAPNSIQILDTP